jgi:hypothetical protein
VARENLVTALDANRSSYSKLAAAAGASGGGGGGGGRGAGAAGPLPPRGARPGPQLERELKIRCGSARVLLLHSQGAGALVFC